MKVTKHDIGGELISIITKGMYADPRDALREYVQNGIDANASNITIRVRPDSISIADNGLGMDAIVMRRAVRVGISDKNPTKSVGFMGIGLYSSFHLCDILTIYSKVKGSTPNKLVFRFKEMREYLDNQKDTRIAGKIKSLQQIDLQTLLEKNIDFTTLPTTSFPKEGSRIEMAGIEPNFFKSLSKEDEVSEYLESVVPLPFSKEFSKGKQIQDYIDNVSKQHKTAFRIINLFLNLDGNDKQLYRPYRDSDFATTKSEGKPLNPEFYVMKNGEDFIGIAWACLNSQRDTIPNAKVRGFIIKKQGFTIGKRSDLITYFGRTTYFNRAVGEFIVMHPKLLPNAPRSDFEYSSLRNSFYTELKEVAKQFSEYADKYQEFEKAENDLANAIALFNIITAQLEFWEGNSDKLLDFFGKLTDTISAMEKKVKAERFRTTRIVEAKSIVVRMTKLKNDVKALIDNKKKKKKKASQKSAAPGKKFIDSEPERTSEPAPEELTDIIHSLGLELSDDLEAILKLIDEKYIKGTASNKENYYQKLIELRDEIDEIFEEE